jgi:hypothetical protein
MHRTIASISLSGAHNVWHEREREKERERVGAWKGEGEGESANCASGGGQLVTMFGDALIIIESLGVVCAR